MGLVIHFCLILLLIQTLVVGDSAGFIVIGGPIIAFYIYKFANMEDEKQLEQEQKDKKVEQENKNKEIKEEYLKQAKQVALQSHKPKKSHRPKTLFNYDIRGWRKAETYEQSGDLIYDIYFNGIHKEVEYSPFKALIKGDWFNRSISKNDIPELLCSIFAEYNIYEKSSGYGHYMVKDDELISDVREKTTKIIARWLDTSHENYLCTYKAAFINNLSNKIPYPTIFKIVSEQDGYEKDSFNEGEELIKQEKVSDIIWNNLTEVVLGDWFYPNLKEFEISLVNDAYEVCNNEDFKTFSRWLDDEIDKNKQKKIYDDTKKIYELFEKTGKWDDLCRKYIEDYAVCEKYIEQHYKTLSLKWKQTHYVDEYGQIIDKGWEQVIKYFTKNVIKDEYISTEQFNKIYDIVSNRHKDEEESSAVDLKTGVDFEYYIENMLKDAGFDVIRTPTTGDQGVDLIAEKERTQIAIQCKFYSKPVGNKAVQEVVAGATYYDCNVGCVVSNNSYTPAARKLANTSNVILASDKDIVDKLNEIVA